MIFDPDLRKQAQEVIFSRKIKKLLNNPTLLSNNIPLKTVYFRNTLLTIYKTFIRRWSDYADIIYDQAYNSAFHDKLESIQYNACLAITGTIRGTSTEKMYQELDLESLKSRRWFKKFWHF